jgi:hypothetical protein
MTSLRTTSQATALADELEHEANRAGREWSYWPLVMAAATALRQSETALATYRDTNHVLRETLRVVRGNTEALTEFFKWAMREGPWDGGGLDGASVQDKAESLGLIVAVKYDRAKHGPHPDFEEGDDFYEFSAALSQAPVTDAAPFDVMQTIDPDFSDTFKSEVSHD